MRLAFLVNRIETEEDNYTTTGLAYEAHRRGHEVWYIAAEDLIYDHDDSVRAHGRAAAGDKDAFETMEAYFEAFRGENAKLERIGVDDLDVLMLRNDPSADAIERPWAQSVGLIFGQMAARRGVIVLNDPDGLAKAQNKLYFQFFPAEVRPRTIISRKADDIKEFIREHHHVVLKPLQGSGGQSVFLVREDDDTPNINQMIDAVSRDGYIVAQEYLPAASEGDVRLFLMNGSPLMHDGKYGAFRRVSAKGDLRSNLHAGGSIERAVITPRMMRIAEIVRPKLVHDGMFLVGLDIAGDKLLEINVFSAGGLNAAQSLEDVNFTAAVIDSLERKVAGQRAYGRRLANVQLATL
jgi:glutathione synthase